LAEELQTAEQQAELLLQLHGITDLKVPIDFISTIPKVRVRFHRNLPASAVTYWNGQHWIVTIKADEPCGRKRSSVLHEVKHILDHPTRHFATGHHCLSASELAEHIADFFAGCVLMPKRLVTNAFHSKTKSPEHLAGMFGVSKRAMRVRLRQLRLIEPRGSVEDRPSLLANALDDPHPRRCRRCHAHKLDLAKEGL
jgi:Zn-dependent peptidase ImmA (M78 family)